MALTELHFMEEVFIQIKQSRIAFFSLIDGLSLEQLNHVPAGFNNNLVWNLGHILVATISLCYNRTGVVPGKSIPLGPKYAKGTKPERTAAADEVDQIKKELLTSIDELEQDYRNQLFKEITPFATDTYRYTMNTIEEVIACTLAHDNYHFGYSSALKRAVLQPVPA